LIVGTVQPPTPFTVSELQAAASSARVNEPPGAIHPAPVSRSTWSPESNSIQSPDESLGRFQRSPQPWTGWLSTIGVVGAWVFQADGRRGVAQICR
jgi:hypothetical protein